MYDFVKDYAKYDKRRDTLAVTITVGDQPTEFGVMGTSVASLAAHIERVTA